MFSNNGKIILVLENKNINEKEIREYRADQLRFKRRFKKEKMDVHDKELRELEKLEKQEKKSNLDDN